jgi:hypothetical protein
MQQPPERTFDRLYKVVLAMNRRTRTEGTSITNPSLVSSGVSKAHAYAGNAAKLGSLPMMATALIGGHRWIRDISWLAIYL